MMVAFIANSVLYINFQLPAHKSCSVIMKPCWNKKYLKQPPRNELCLDVQRIASLRIQTPPENS